jgi:hypothetical protein
LLHFGLGLALMGALIRTGIWPLVALAISSLTLIAIAYCVARYLEPRVRQGLRNAFAIVAAR